MAISNSHCGAAKQNTALSSHQGLSLCQLCTHKTLMDNGDSQALGTPPANRTGLSFWSAFLCLQNKQGRICFYKLISKQSDRLGRKHVAHRRSCTQRIHAPEHTLCKASSGLCKAMCRSFSTMLPSQHPTEQHQPCSAAAGMVPCLVRPFCKTGHLSSSFLCSHATAYCQDL